MPILTDYSICAEGRSGQSPSGWPEDGRGAEGLPEREGDRLTVLYACHDVVTASLVQAVLSREGYDALASSSAAEAVGMAGKEHVDIAVLDAIIPDMDGGAAREVKARSGDRFLPVILLTGGDAEEAVRQGVDNGADDFVPRPLSQALLSAKIRSAARTRRLYEVLRCQKEELSRAYQQLQFEHDMAQRVFNSILENKGVEAPNLSCFLKPTSIANGDLVIWAIRPNGGQHVLLGDFTGHGLGAALGAVAVHDIFDTMTSKGFDLAEIGAEINRKLFHKLPTECFLAACMMELAPDVSQVRIWNAGVPPVVLQGPDGRIRRSVSRYLPLGVAAEAAYNSPEILGVRPGERVYLYTDGVVEAAGHDGEHFGTSRLERCLQSSVHSPSAVERVRRELEIFQDDALQQDDITLVEVQCDRELLVQARGAGKMPRRSAWAFSLHLESAALRRFDPMVLLDLIASASDGVAGRRSELYTVVSELYTNALEHGVLGIPASLKDSEAGFDEYYRQIERGLAAEHEGWVNIRAEVFAGRRLSVTVEDSGSGIPDPAQDMSHVDFSGRGLAVAHALCESLAVDGSRVKAVFAW